MTIVLLFKWFIGDPAGFSIFGVAEISKGLALKWCCKNVVGFLDFIF